jgi:hypothetical protein
MTVIRPYVRPLGFAGKVGLDFNGEWYLLAFRVFPGTREVPKD